MKHARVDSVRRILSCSIYRHRINLLFLATLLLLGHSAAMADNKSPRQMLNDIQQQQLDLENQRREFAADKSSDLAQRWQTLTEGFVFTEENKKILAEDIRLAELLLQENQPEDAKKLLKSVQQRYQKMAEDLSLIGKTLAAEDRAEQTRQDSKMYFMMRVRSKLPAKTLKAYGIMELAKRERDKGEFAAALDLWNQAEVMVKESFNEHIAGMAEWREEATQQAKTENQNIRTQVETLLADYFVDIPAGRFLMGSRDGGLDEAPQHNVEISAFRLGKTEVTFELYDLCVTSTRCYANPNDQGWGRNDRPVTNVSYRDITQQFLPWLNELTGKQYRLPSEAEWEYAARAGSEAEYTWGDNITCTMARFDGGSTSVCNARDGKNRSTAPVMSYQPNAFGLYDMHGNLWEWVEDCWNPTYDGAPNDGSAWLGGNCQVRVLRGGSWDYHKSGLRSANRYYFSQKVRRPNYGFRLAEDK